MFTQPSWFYFVNKTFFGHISINPAVLFSGEFKELDEVETNRKDNNEKYEISCFKESGVALPDGSIPLHCDGHH